MESKKFIYSHNGSLEIFWVALIEKAYAKLHGNYSYLKKLGFKDILVDLSNCYITCIDLEDPEKEQLIQSKKLYNNLMNYDGSKENYLLTCIKSTKSKKNLQMDMGEYGILSNLMHAILSLEDVPNRDFKFFRIRNFWGSETNWSGPFSKNSDEWDKYKNLRDEFLHSKKYISDS